MANGEFAANPDVPPAAHIRDWADVETDPIDVERGRALASRGGRADAARRVEVAARAAAGGPPGWTLAASPSRRSSPGRCSRCRSRSSGEGDASTRSRRACCPRRWQRASCWRRASAPGRSCSAARWRRSSPSSTSPAAAGSTGRSCCRWRCRPTCSCSCCSASTTRRARCSAPLRAVFGDGSRLPDVRTTVGHDRRAHARAVPVRVRARRAARSSGSRGRRSRLRARSGSRTPPRCGGSRSRSPARRWRPASALAVMEALADFGAVNLLNYRALTDAIYRVWYGAFDQAAALQLATVLVSLTLTLVALERLLRGRARYHQALARGEAVVPRATARPGGAGSRRPAAGAARWLVVVVAPVVQLRRVGRPVARRGRRRPTRSRAPRSTACCWRRSRRSWPWRPRPSSPTARAHARRGSARRRRA